MNFVTIDILIFVSWKVGPTGKVTGIDHINELVEDSIKNVLKWDPDQIRSGHIHLICNYCNFYN